MTATIENVLELYQTLAPDKRRAFLDVVNEQENWTPSNDDIVLIRQRIQDVEEGSATLMSRDDMRASMARTRENLRNERRTKIK